MPAPPPGSPRPAAPPTVPPAASMTNRHPRGGQTSSDARTPHSGPGPPRFPLPRCRRRSRPGRCRRERSPPGATPLPPTAAHSRLRRPATPPRLAARTTTPGAGRCRSGCRCGTRVPGASPRRRRSPATSAHRCGRTAGRSSTAQSPIGEIAVGDDQRGMPHQQSRTGELRCRTSGGRACARTRCSRTSRCRGSCAPRRRRSKSSTRRRSRS